MASALKLKNGVVLPLLGLMLIVTIIIASSVGAVSIPLATILGSAWSKTVGFTGSHVVGTGTKDFIIWQIRLPRVVLSMLVGASLAVAGVVTQGLFKNPMADPYIVGVSFGGGLGATVALLYGAALGFGEFLVPVAALLGALGATFLVYNLARTGGRVPVSTLILSGIAVGSFFSAIISLLMTVHGEDLQSVVFWLMGGMAARSWRHVGMVIPFIAVGFALAMAFSRELNVMVMGDERAYQLGVDIERAKKVLIVAVSLLAGAAVSVSGLIGFVGLIIPHVVRLVIGPDHRILLPCSALVGAIFLIFTDTLARTILAPAEIPVGIITALFGTPFFMYLLRTKRNSLA
ncbi:MAG: iron chelate uptake ABC transporter family permease subunit [Actinomycetota bacterium]|nr:iron chelate uptake ABC transporter family permease subunit [Actinomycetota bacterium]